MKNFEKLLFIALLVFTVPMVTNAATDKAVTCKELVKKDGSSVFFGPSGEVMGSEQAFINACQQTCIIHKDKIYYEEFFQPKYPNIPYCEPNFTYAARGCFSGATMTAFAAYKSSSWLTTVTGWLNNYADEELKNYVANNPDKVYKATNKQTGQEFIYIEDMSYDADSWITYEGILKSYTDKVCSVLRRGGKDNRGATVLSYSTWLSRGDIQQQLGAQIVSITSSLASVNAALDSGRAVLMSLSKDGTFTKSTHYISVIARDGNQYLVMHSGATNPSGWYDVSVIRNAIAHIHAGVWSFIPDDCYDKIYEVESTNSCTCDASTGEYKYVEYDHSGNITKTDTWTTSSFNFQDKMNEYAGKGCPATCENNYCRHEGDSFYGPDGKPTDKDTFYENCCDQLDKDSDEYKKNCSCGTPEIDFIGACTEFNSNNEYLNNHVADAPDDAQLKYCLFNSTNHDIAKNSYEMTDQSSVTNNPYCRVSCIEDFDFKVPNAQYTLSGSYFTLGTEVKGTRKCYVNQKDGYDGIDYTKFENDLEAKRKEIIDAYNVYAKWKAAASTTEESETLTCSYSGRTCGPNSSSSCTSCSSGSDSKTGYKKSWEWVEYDYNGNSSTRHDSYGPGTSSNGTCSCSINAEASRHQSHISSRDSALSTLNTKISEYNNIIRTYNDCTGVISSTGGNSISFPGITSSGWENNFNFDPIVQFEYDEPYTSMINDEFEKVETLSTSSSSNYCTGDVGDTYNCNGSGSLSTTTLSRFVCTSSGCGYVGFNVSNVKYIIKSKTESARYEPRNYFSIYTPSGTVTLDKDSGTYLLYTGLCDGSGACLPIALNTNTGVFNFKFRFSNVGQFNDNNTNGRLIGQSNSVFNISEGESEAGYVCHYVNNCPGCDYVCVGDACHIRDDSCGDHCTYTCMNCLFDGNNNTFFYRTVSLNSLFPNTRAHGYNWDNSELYDTNEKATYTIDKIHESGENVYTDPEYSYSLSPQQMGRIREYNKQVGGYLNTRMGDNSTDSLHCESRSINGKNYQNIVCYSAFLDTKGNTYFTQLKRNDIWTLWPESGYYQNQNQYSVVLGIGPAWK